MKIFNDNEFLNETPIADDIFGFQNQQEAFINYLDTVDTTSIISMTGKYGSGKSRLLYGISKERDDEVWLFFDAWKYPNKEELWEGFVLDIAAQIGLKEKITNKIDGKLSQKQTIVSGSVKSLYGIVDLLSGIPAFKNIADSILKAYEPAPVKRIFQLQEILEGMLASQDKSIVIVVEDIDRSGEDGIRFIETLSNFLRESEIKNEIRVIAPMSKDKYQENIESFYKSIDSHYDFDASIGDMDNFIENVLSEDLFIPENLPIPVSLGSNKLKIQLKTFLEQLVLSMEITPRQFKAMCRDWNNSYKRLIAKGLKPDYRVVLLVQASKYIKTQSSLTDFEDIKQNKNKLTSNVLTAYVRMIVANDIYMKKMNSEEYNLPYATIRFIDVNGANSSVTEGYNNDNSEQELYIPKFYLN